MGAIYGFNWEDKGLVKRMADILFYRGPDGEGSFVSKNFSLGVRTVSILESNEKSTQPIYDKDKKKCIVFDGRIYNFFNLKKELEGKGHRFYSDTDGEVVLHAYEEYGLECIHRFNGPFTFAIWDDTKQELFLVRDRVGIKSMYYYYDGRKFMFASEIKAMLEDKTLSRELNHQSLYYYLGYEFVPAPDTMFKNIYKLRPGNYLVYRDGNISIKRYWNLEFHPENRPESYYKEKIISLIDEAVRDCLIGDVSKGVFLSGGLDSTSVVAFMRKYIKGPIKSYALDYPDKSYSDLDYSQEAARYYNTEHSVLMIDKITVDDIEDAVWHLDEPMADLSAMPFGMICKRARRDVKVCLGGEGGDEVFVGYDRFKASRIYHCFYKYIPFLFRRGISSVMDRISDKPQKKGAVNMLKRFIHGADLSEEGGHMRWQYFSSPSQDGYLYKSDFKKSVDLNAFSPVVKSRSQCNTLDRLSQELYIDIAFALPESALMKGDKLSMASSLEVRLPFLDYRVIEFAAQIPSRMKFRWFTTKAIFREAMKGILPEDIRTRGKQGYSIPSKAWLRGYLREYMIDLLNTSPVIKENLNLDYVKLLISQHLAMTHNHNHILWALLNLAIWHNKFFK